MVDSFVEWGASKGPPKPPALVASGLGRDAPRFCDRLLAAGKTKEPVRRGDLQAARYIQGAKGILAQGDGHRLAGVEGQLAFPVEGHHPGFLVDAERLIGAHSLPAADA